MCLKRKRRHWLGRLAAEFHMCDTARFVTLTYDDDHVKSGLALPPEHLKQYFRQRRKKYKFRHFTVGEYGDATERPHWHSLQFFYGVVPDDPLNFSTENYGWTRGNSQYEPPRSIAGAAAYVYDYLDKGGKAIKPSPGMGRVYLVNFAKMAARNRRRIASEYGVGYYVPGVRKPGGGLWTYWIPNGHHYAPMMVEAYLMEWQHTHDDEPDYNQFSGVNYDG